MNFGFWSLEFAWNLVLGIYLEFGALFMLILFAQIILIISLLGIAMILLRKIPVLVQLPEINNLSTKKRVFTLKKFRSISIGKLLQKVLEGLKILALKIKREISGWFQKSHLDTVKANFIQQNWKAKMRRNNLDENYWAKLKKVNKSSRHKLK